MKTRIALFLGVISFVYVFSSCASTAKTKPGLSDKPFEYIYAFDGFSKDSLFKKSKLWIANTYNSAEKVITFDDLDSGVIKGNGVTKIPSHSMLAPFILKYSLAIDVKDGKTRLVINNFSGFTSEYETLHWNLLEYQVYYDDIKNYCDGLAANYSQFMKQDTQDW
jgi:hypothetical protein